MRLIGRQKEKLVDQIHEATMVNGKDVCSQSARRCSFGSFDGRMDQLSRSGQANGTLGPISKWGQRAILIFSSDGHSWLTMPGRCPINPKRLD
ncbi:hypothetical protein [Cohaesibacter sp. ES.047]|uniref:hypothetical protein n=1 Tax=Cohaesibacter sp. ES.047 TaxID=1798205 RepID=UPI000BB6BC6E|nr:hypothetical protein [Cohaesibacter sp. ES.047]